DEAVKTFGASAGRASFTSLTRLVLADGRYEIRQLLGQGSGGRVYEAFDRQLGQEIALKMVRLGSADDVYRLKREFRALADLYHPNIVQLHHLFVEGSDCFFTMELVRGRNFVEWVRHGEGAIQPIEQLDSDGLTRLRSVTSQLLFALEA